MTINEFIWTVAEMRDAQKHYFETRDPRVLRVACKLERMIDKELDFYRNLYDTYTDDRIEIEIRFVVKDDDV